MINKNSFLSQVINFSREDFRKYLYRNINKKQKLIEPIIFIDDLTIKNKKSIINK